jgi:hypothetical protein
MLDTSILSIFGLLSGILSALCYVPYIRGIIKHKVKPERASWLIWSVLTAIGFFSNLAIGATHSLWLPGVQGVGVIIVLVLSIKHGYGGLLKRDILTLIASAFTLVIWYFTKQPVVAVYLTTLIDAMGGYLTVIKSYEEPDTETPVTWAMSAIAGFFALLSVGRLDASLLAYPLYIFLINGAVVIAILLGRRARQLKTI